MEGGIERGCHSEGDVGIICGSYSSYIPLSDGRIETDVTHPSIDRSLTDTYYHHHAYHWEVEARLVGDWPVTERQC